MNMCICTYLKKCKHLGRAHTQIIYTHFLFAHIYLYIYLLNYIYIFIYLCTQHCITYPWITASLSLSFSLPGSKRYRNVRRANGLIRRMIYLLLGRIRSETWNSLCQKNRFCSTFFIDTQGANIATKKDSTTA